VLQDPPAICLHSLQDGRVTLSSSNIPLSVPEGSLHLSNIWWFRDERDRPVLSSIPDIFKRNDTIVRYPLFIFPELPLILFSKTGSAHSVLKLLPLLDNIQEEREKSTYGTAHSVQFGRA
jgi:anaphase-promoting complex subunit 4